MKWAWEDTYKKWFGPNWNVVNILTIILVFILASAGVVLAILTIKKHIDVKHSTDQNKTIILKKERNKFFWSTLLSFSFPIIWPIITTLVNIAGLGQITGGSNYLEIIFLSFRRF